MQQRGCVAIKGREAAFMFAQRFLVQPYAGAIIRRAEMEKGARIRLSVIVKRFLVPERAFVPLQFRPLKVPITRHAKSWRGIEIVFDEIPAARRLSIQVKAPRRSLLMWVNDVMPIAVERERAPTRHVLD